MSGIRFSPFSTAQQPQQQVPVMKVPPKPKQYSVKNNLSGSDTDVSTSNENLTKEERFVIRHTARVEPQGQENLNAGKITPVNDNSQIRLTDNQPLIFSSNTSSDSTNRYATPTSQRSVSEARNANQHDSNRSSLIATTNSNRNSLKESNSNRSSMDVSQSSYNTLIIHNDELQHDYTSPPPYGSSTKKDRPRSYGERQEVEEYLNQSHILKHLAKEVKLPRNPDTNNTRDSGVSENEPPRYHPQQPQQQDDTASGNRLKSKSQPDLTNLENEYEDIEDLQELIKENAQLKEQLNIMYHKLAKSQKLQQEISNIQRDYEAMVQSNERREKLELTARTRLQNELIRSQDLNRALRDQNEALQNQLLTMPDHQLERNQQDALMQFAAQHKEMAEANKRQYIEIQELNVTLEDQRAHIHFLDNAVKRLQDENRQKQPYVDRCNQLQYVLHNLQNASERRENVERKLLLETTYGNNNKDDSNANQNAVAQDATLKWQIREKDNQIMRLEAECAKLEQRNVEDARNAAKINVENQESERAIAEAKQEKIRYLDELHLTNRKVDDLQTKLKVVESRLAEKEAMVRALQSQKTYGGGGSNSFGPYNLSTESFGLNTMGGYNSQTSFDASNNSFDVSNPTASLLDPNTYGPSSSSASISTTYTPGYGQTNPTYNQSAINLQTINYSPVSSSYKSSNYTVNKPFTQSSTNLDPIFDSYDARRIEEQLKQLDEALLSKRGLCCLPGLGKKPPSLLSDNSGQLSSNASETLLSSLQQIDHRSRSRSNQEQENKGEEMMLLVKQGVSSQKTRNNTVGNLAQVTQNVGQNMTDISNIDHHHHHNKRSPSPKGPQQMVLASNLPAGILPPRKDRGNSLPPPLPRPPRSLKPPRKIEYGRLESDYSKKRSNTPPTPTAQQEFELKSSTLKRGSDYKRTLADTMKFSRDKQHIKNYGTIFHEDKFGFKPEYVSRSDHNTSTRNYQRLDEPSRKMNQNNSLIPNAGRKETKPLPKSNGSRDSLNSASSGSNNSQNSSTPVRSSPLHTKTDSNSSTSTYRRNLSPPMMPTTHQQKTSSTTSFIASAKNRIQQFNQKSSSLPSSSILHKKASATTTATASTSSASTLPPIPSDSKGQQRRGHSLARGENRYRIMQF